MRTGWVWLLLAALMSAGCGDEPKEPRDRAGECTSGDSASDEGEAQPGPDEDVGRNGGANDDAGEAVKPETLPELPGDEVRTNQAYRNGETLKMSIYGVSFKLPEGVACGIAQDAAAMELASTEKQSLGVIFLKRDVDVDDVIRQVRQPQQIEGVVLTLQGEPEKRDGAWFLTHTDATYEAHTALIVGPQKNGVLYFLGGMKGDSAYFKGIVEALAGSTTIGTPLESQSVAQWKQLLAGHKLTYMKSSYSPDYAGNGYTGHSDKRVIQLFPDGSCTYRASSNFAVQGGYGSGSAYGADKDGERGQWSIEQVGAAHMLVLKSDEGAREWQIAWSNNKLYLNGKRWFRTPIE